MFYSLKAPTTLGSNTKTTASTDAETLVTADDAPIDYPITVTLQPGGDYSVNVGCAADQTEFVITQGGSLTLQVNQLSKIYVKTAQTGQKVNYIYYY